MPLRLADAAILSAKIGDEAARLTFDPKQGYTLMVKNDGADAKAITLDLVYAKTISKSSLDAASRSFQANALCG